MRTERPVKWRRWASRVCLAAALALGLSAVAGFGLDAAGAASSDQTANRPFAYAGFASTGAVFLQIDTVHGLEAVTQPLYDRATDGLSRFTSTADFARSSVVYPGATLQAPGTVGCLVPSAFPPGLLPKPLATIVCGLPKNPLSISADDGTPDASVNGGPGVGSATAHADQDHAKTDATLAGVDLGSLTGSQQNILASLVNTIGTALNQPTIGNLISPSSGPVSVVHIAGVESHTLQNFTNGGSTLTTLAHSALSGVDILGGLIHIGSIAVSTTAVADGQKAPIRTNKTNVKDVTVAGQPASIGPDGITVGSTSIGKGTADMLSKALNSGLKAMGMEIQLLGTSPTSVTDPTTCQSGESDGVLFKDNIDLSNLPPSAFPTLPGLGRPFGPDVYFVHFVLGGACADASALLNSDTGLGGDLGGAGGTTGGGTGGSAQSPGAAGLNGANGGTGLGSATNPLLASPGQNRRSTRPGSRNRTSRNGFLEADLRGLVANRVKVLYLTFTLVFLGIFLGYRPFLPARLPGP
jgi:hypothetical protein